MQENSRFWFLRPRQFGRALLIFLQDWWFNRPWKRLLRGTPAIVVAVGVGLIVFRGYSIGNEQLVARYDRASRAAVQMGEDESAAIYLRKLTVLDPQKNKHRFSLATLAEKQDDKALARRLMSQLAPLDRTGYGPAHYWLALDALRDENRTPETPQFARTHLLHTVAAQPENVDAHALLGSYYVAEREFDQAANHLEKIVAARPQARLTLASVYVALGQKQRARDQASQAVDYFAKQLRKNPRDIDARLVSAQGHLFLEEFAPAADLLRQGLALQNDERLQAMLAQVYLAWSDRTPDTEIGKRLERLQMALTLAPNQPELLRRLAAFARKRNPEWEKARDQLNDVLASGQAPAVVHLILGSLAVEEQEVDNALLHLEQAYRHNPRMPAVVNNLAWVLANSQPPQLERALRLADAAVKSAPQHAEIRDTRGTIHWKLGQWKEAIADLEFALAALPQRVRIHEALAECYQHLGDERLAAKHRELANAEPDSAKEPVDKGPQESP